MLCLQPDLAPVTVNNFVVLARNHFYDGLTFHRVVAGFVIQGGDPKGDGSGGPGYKFNDEPVHQAYVQGALAMANSGANSNGSQFFICTADDTTKLQPLYNLFGQVVSGNRRRPEDRAGRRAADGDRPAAAVTGPPHDRRRGGVSARRRCSPAASTARCARSPPWAVSRRSSPPPRARA